MQIYSTGIKKTAILFKWHTFSLCVLKMKTSYSWVNKRAKDRTIEGFSHQEPLHVNWRAQINMSSAFKAYLTFLIFALWVSLFVSSLVRPSQANAFLGANNSHLLSEFTPRQAVHYRKALLTLFQGFSHSVYTLYPKMEIS